MFRFNQKSYKWHFNLIKGWILKFIFLSIFVEIPFYESYLWIKCTVPYKDPLWAYIEIDPRGKINITGRQSEFVGPSPGDMVMDKKQEIFPIVPWISNRELKM